MDMSTKERVTRISEQPEDPLCLYLERQAVFRTSALKVKPAPLGLSVSSIARVLTDAVLGILTAFPAKPTQFCRLQYISSQNNVHLCVGGGVWCVSAWERVCV